MLKTIIWIFAIIIIFVIAVLLLLFFGQEKLIFHPEKLSKDHKYTFQNKFEEYFIKVDNKTELNALHFKADSSKGLVFYLHGNAGNLDSWGDVADLYLNLNYDVFILDYRGYGKSTGEIKSELQIRRDIQKAYDFVCKDYKENEIIIIGYSIGTGPAAKLAAKNNPRILILKAPYYNLTDLVHHYSSFIPTSLLKYKFRINKNLKRIKAPIYIFHGNLDEVIYYKSSVKLSKLLKEKDEFITLKGQIHNGINENEEYISYIKQILN
ncbi:MAG: alpha/beta hydrolase [Bacteroidetes bacterium]|nr:MAG: alpha/beta hydrolase [Bacteroidota bacterium]